MLAIIFERVRLCWFDYDRRKDALLFLQRGVSVIPVGAGLVGGKVVGVGFARRDAVKTDARDAIHIGLQNNAVPVKGSVDIECIGDIDGHVFAFP